MDVRDIALDDLIDASGIAERYGLSRATVSNWQARFEDFPRPLNLPLCRGNSLWDVCEIQAWMDANTAPMTSRTLRKKA